MATFSAKPETVQRDWYVVDASDKILGRLASVIASRLRGKHKPIFTPHVDTGDNIVVINADKIKIKGNNKALDKVYYYHTGYPGGIKGENFSDKLARKPEQIIELAVKRMLPKNPLGRQMFRKLKVYAGDQHPHAAQNPQALEIEEA